MFKLVEISVAQGRRHLNVATAEDGSERVEWEELDTTSVWTEA